MRIPSTSTDHFRLFFQYPIHLSTDSAESGRSAACYSAPSASTYFNQQQQQPSPSPVPPQQLSPMQQLQAASVKQRVGSFRYAKQQLSKVRHF